MGQVASQQADPGFRAPPSELLQLLRRWIDEWMDGWLIFNDYNSSNFIISMCVSGVGGPGHPALLPCLRHPGLDRWSAPALLQIHGQALPSRQAPWHRCRDWRGFDTQQRRHGDDHRWQVPSARGRCGSCWKLWGRHSGRDHRRHSQQHWSGSRSRGNRRGSQSAPLHQRYSQCGKQQGAGWEPQGGETETGRIFREQHRRASDHKHNIRIKH